MGTQVSQTFKYQDGSQNLAINALERKENETNAQHLPQIITYFKLPQSSTIPKEKCCWVFCWRFCDVTTSMLVSPGHHGAIPANSSESRICTLHLTNILQLILPVSQTLCQHMNLPQFVQSAVPNFDLSPSIWRIMTFKSYPQHPPGFLS